MRYTIKIGITDKDLTAIKRALSADNSAECKDVLRIIEAQANVQEKDFLTAIKNRIDDHKARLKRPMKRLNGKNLLSEKINVDGGGYWEGQYDAFELIEEDIDRLNFL